MSTYQWPVALPAPSRAFEVNVSHSTIRSVLEQGVTNQRNIFETNSTFFSVTWDFTDDERKAFKGILKHKLNHGADRFKIFLPANVGFEEVTGRIVEGRYSESYRGVLRWSVSVTIECRDVPTWPPEVFEFFRWAEGAGFTFEELESATSDLYHLVNTLIPLTMPK